MKVPGIAMNLIKTLVIFVAAALLTMPTFAAQGNVRISEHSSEFVELTDKNTYTASIPPGAKVTKPDGTILECPQTASKPCVFTITIEKTKTYYVEDTEDGAAVADITPKTSAAGIPNQYSCKIESIPGTNTLTLNFPEDIELLTQYGPMVLEAGEYTVPEEYKLNLVLDCRDLENCIVYAEDLVYEASSVKFPNGFETGDFSFRLGPDSDFNGSANWETGEFIAEVKLIADMPYFRIDDGTEEGAPLTVQGTISGKMTPSPKNIAHGMPTLSQWGLIALGILLAGSLVWVIRRRFRTKPVGA